jgi:chromosomal replication initiation ATPase DnaA
VELVFSDDKVLARNVKMYLSQRYTGEELKDIGRHFGIGESGVSQAGRRVAQKIENDKQPTKRIAKISKKMILSRMKT